MSDREQEQLGRAFSRLHEDDARAAPPFRPMWERARVRRRKTGWGWAGLSVAAAGGAAFAAAGLMLLVTGVSRDLAPTIAMTQLEWEPAPLDFLLTIPSQVPSPTSHVLPSGRAGGTWELARVPDFDSDPLVGATRSMPRGLE